MPLIDYTRVAPDTYGIRALCEIAHRAKSAHRADHERGKRSIVRRRNGQRTRIETLPDDRAGASSLASVRAVVNGYRFGLGLALARG